MVHAIFGTGEFTEEMRQSYKRLCICLAMLPGFCYFLVGNETEYEQSVVSLMREIYDEYPCIDYAIISVPESKGETRTEEIVNYPKILRNLPYDLSVQKRTEWMIEHADTLLCNVAEGDKVNEKLLAEAKEEGKEIFAEGDSILPNFKEAS